MKLIFAVITCFVLATSCATIAHKNVDTTWSGFGVNVEYQSTVAIPPEEIPAFIDAINKLEKIIKEFNNNLTK